MKRIIKALRKPNSRKHLCAAFGLFATMAIALPAQTPTILHSFDGTDGQGPFAGLIQATNGDLYGTTSYGGANCVPIGCGTVFKITPGGALTSLYSFCSQVNCTDGVYPTAGLVQDTDGYLYGTTIYGGANACPAAIGSPANGCGTIFKITPSGTLTTLHNFCAQNGCEDGGGPSARLVRASNGEFYGTTGYGGANNCAPIGGCGTVFKITPSGTLTTLYRFDGPDGLSPNGLIQATNGDLYGSTYYGGANNCAPYGCGTIFKITPSGALTTLHRFDGTDGAYPDAQLIQAANGAIYGTTQEGGDAGNGLIFKITLSGTLTTLYTFGGPDGEDPNGLVQATDGDFYGTTLGGGANFGGTIFKITPSGTLTTLYNNCNPGNGCADGQYNGLFQATNGTFYGTTVDGGTNGDGIVFSISVGLGPFVSLRTPFGKVGTVIDILGTDLTGATSVSFNGTGAVFEVVSSALITATVPADASTGTVEVVTPGGTLSSNVPFRVLP